MYRLKASKLVLSAGDGGSTGPESATHGRAGDRVAWDDEEAGVSAGHMVADRLPISERGVIDGSGDAAMEAVSSWIIVVHLDGTDLVGRNRLWGSVKWSSEEES